MPKQLILIGYGGFGKTVEDVVRQLGKYETIIVLDDQSPVAVGTIDEFQDYVDSDAEFFVAIGNNAFRVDLCQRIQRVGGVLATIIHPTAYVSPTATVCPGSIIMPLAVVNTSVSVGPGCIVNCSAVVDHDTLLSKGVHIGLNAVVKADNCIPELMKVEANCVIQNGYYRLEK